MAIHHWCKVYFYLYKRLSNLYSVILALLNSSLAPQNSGSCTDGLTFLIGHVTANVLSMISKIVQKTILSPTIDLETA